MPATSACSFASVQGHGTAGALGAAIALVSREALDVQRMLAEGQTEIVREFTQALVDWFPGHADYMDSALATWLVKQAHNGRPLVFRRKEKSAQ